MRAATGKLGDTSHYAYTASGTILRVSCQSSTFLNSISHIVSCPSRGVCTICSATFQLLDTCHVFRSGPDVGRDISRDCKTLRRQDRDAGGCSAAQELTLQPKPVLSQNCSRPISCLVTARRCVSGIADKGQGG